jgi:hypothetical protein
MEGVHGQLATVLGRVTTLIRLDLPDASPMSANAASKHT